MKASFFLLSQAGRFNEPRIPHTSVVGVSLLTISHLYKKLLWHNSINKVYKKRSIELATQMIDGFGEIQLRSLEGGLFVGGFAQVSVEGDISTADAFRFNNTGRRVKSDSRITEESYTLTLTAETHDLRGFELSIGEKASVETSVSYYKLVEATVPLNSPYVITLTDITAANDETVMITMFGNGSWNGNGAIPLDLNVALTGTPSNGTAVVNGTNGQITFHSSQAGAPVLISYLVTAASKLAIGLDSTPTSINNFYFSCKIISDEFPNGLVFIAPQVSKTSPFAFTSEDVSVIENTFSIGTAPGYRLPYHLIQL